MGENKIWKTVFGIRPTAQCFILAGLGQDFTFRCIPITNTLHTRHTCTNIFQSLIDQKLLRVCIRCCLSLQRNPLSYFHFRKLHQKMTFAEFLFVSINYTTIKPLFPDSSPSSCANSFSDTKTRMCVSGSLRIPGCFFLPAALRGNTQSVINHGRCLWEGSGTFLLHCTDKLHYHQRINPTLMRDIHTVWLWTRRHNVLYHLYGHVLTHYGHILCTHKFTHSFMHTRSYIKVCDTLNINSDNLDGW